MMFPVVRELAADGIPVAVACRVLNVSTSGYYDWRDRLPSPRAIADAALTETITAAHAASQGTYGARRVHAELRLGHGVRVGRKAGGTLDARRLPAGGAPAEAARVHPPRSRRAARRGPGAAPVQR